MNSDNSNEKPYTRELVQFSRDLFQKGLPKSVERKVKELIQDQIGLQLGCSEFPWSKAVYKYQQQSALSIGQSTIFHYGDKASPEIAAFINGTFGHAQDFDDTCLMVQTHPAAVIVPVAMAIGESVSASGRDVMTAIGCGLEVMVRIAHSVSPGCLQRGHHTPQATGPYGAAIAAGLLLNLSEEELLNAVAIAGSFSGGLIEYTQSGGSTKRIHCAIPTTAGIRAAFFAKNGLTGPHTVLEGKKGFCRVYSDTTDLERLTRDLGSRFIVEHVDLKKYNCCYFIHCPLEATLELVSENSLEVSEIEKILVGTCRHATTHVGKIRRPKDALGAQFSTAFVLALGLLREIPGVDSYTDEILADDELLRFTDKVDVYEDEVCTSEYPANWGSVVTIKMKNGTSFVRRKRDPKGSINNPLSRDELFEKFGRNLGNVGYSLEQARAIFNEIDYLDNYRSINDFTFLLSRSVDARNEQILKLNLSGADEAAPEVV